MYSNSYQFNFIPTLYKEYKGKKFIYSGQYRKNKELIKDLKRTMFKNGYYTKIQLIGQDFILWCKKK